MSHVRWRSAFAALAATLAPNHAIAEAASLKCDGASDDSAAFAALAVDAQNRHSTLSVPSGTCLLDQGLAMTLTGDLSIAGTGRLKVNERAWPYPGRAWLDIDARGHRVSVSGVTIDQSWNTAIHKQPPGFDDGKAPSTWGGDWTVRIAGASAVTLDRVKFVNIMRGVYMIDGKNIVAAHNSFAELAANATSLWAFENCTHVELDSNTHTGISWMESPAHYTINGEYSWNSSHLAFKRNVWYGLQIVNRCQAVGDCTDILYDSNTLDTPVADTSTGNFQHMVSIHNRVSNSGDMGITCDNCNFVRIVGNIINGVATGGIAVSTGRVAATGSTATRIDISDNRIVNPVQDYPAIQILSNRRASSAGEWASCIGIYTQAPAETVSTNVLISGNRCTMTSAPPERDSGGPVRSIARAIICGVTTNPVPQECVIRRNVVRDETGVVPGFIIFAAEHRLVGGYELTGDPGPGEVFTDESTANSFALIAAYRSMWLWVRSLQSESIAMGDRFVGRHSRSVISFLERPAIEANHARLESNQE